VTTFVVVLLVLTALMVILTAILRLRMTRRVMQTTQRQAEQSARNLLWVQRTLAGKDGDK